MQDPKVREVLAKLEDLEESGRRRFDAIESTQASISGKVDQAIDTARRAEESSDKALAKVVDLNGHVTEIMVELGGVEDPRFRDPNRRSIRRRLHDLEQTKYAAEAAGAALGLLFGRISRWVVVLGALVAGIAGIVEILHLLLR